MTWTTRARRELWEIADDLILGRPSASERWLTDVARAMEDLQTFPQIGRVVPEFHQTTLREILLPPYRIIYRIKAVEQSIHILTVFHSRRILPLTASE